MWLRVSNKSGCCRPPNCVGGSLVCLHKSFQVVHMDFFFFSFFKLCDANSALTCPDFSCGPAQGIFLVYDITSERSFQHIMKWASDVDEVSQSQVAVSESLAHVFKILLCLHQPCSILSASPLRCCCRLFSIFFVPLALLPASV